MTEYGRLRIRLFSITSGTPDNLKYQLSATQGANVVYFGGAGGTGSSVYTYDGDLTAPSGGGPAYDDDTYDATTMSNLQVWDLWSLLTTYGDSADTWSDTVDIQSFDGGGDLVMEDLTTGNTITTSGSVTSAMSQAAIENSAFIFAEPKGGPHTRHTVMFLVSTMTCLHEDTLIETDKGMVPIRDISRGSMVKTYQEGFQPVSRNPKSRARVLVAMEKDALKSGVPNQKTMFTTGHPIKYGRRYVCVGQFLNNRYAKNELIYKETLGSLANVYNLQFDKHYTFNANGVEVQSIPTTTCYHGMRLPEELFHDKSLYDASKIGDESTYLHRSEKDLFLPLTKEDVEVFKSME